MRDASDAGNATTSTIIGRHAAFLRNDGSVTALDGTSPLSFNRSFNDSLFAVVLHRNHIAVMSAKPLTKEADVYNYDFTEDTTKAWHNNEKPVNGKAVLFGGDFNGDGAVNDNDLLLWRTKAGHQGYLTSDGLFDKQTDNKDKNELQMPNKGVNAEIPKDN